MARAQERIRLVGLLNILAEDDPESRLRIAAFKKSLQELCWTDGSIRIEARWADGDVERLRKHAKELVALGPDVILTSGSVTVRPLQQATRTMTRVAVVRDRPSERFRDRPVRRDSSLCAAVRRGVDPYRRT